MTPAGHLTRRTYNNGITHDLDEQGRVWREETGSGIVRTWGSDGSVEIDMPGGIHISVDASGNVSAVDGSGTTRTATFDAATHETRLYDVTGTYVATEIYHATDACIATHVTGDLYWFTVLAPDGSMLESRRADGHVTRFRSGVEIHLDPTGQVERICSGALEAVEQADGTWTLARPDGSTLTYDAQGTCIRLAWANGRSAGFDAAGRLVSLSALGETVSLTYDSPGNVTLHNPDGSTCTRNLDPHATLALAPGTGASWGDSQAHLVAVLDFQGHLEVTEYLEAGATRTLHSDGTSELSQPDGLHEWHDVDGRLTRKTLPGGLTGHLRPRGRRDPHHLVRWAGRTPSGRRQPGLDEALGRNHHLV